MVSHAGCALLRELATVTGLADAVTGALLDTCRGFPVHMAGQVFADLTMAIADGVDAVTGIEVLRDRGTLFGPVASMPTAPPGRPGTPRPARCCGWRRPRSPALVSPATRRADRYRQVAQHLTICPYVPVSDLVTERCASAPESLGITAALTCGLRRARCVLPTGPGIEIHGPRTEDQ